MRRDLLDILRCPFCGGPCEVYGHDQRTLPEVVVHGVLGCACCAYPIVDGVPIMKTSDELSDAIRAVERGAIDEARRLVTDLPERDHVNLRAPYASFADAVATILPDGEGDYYVRRFGDPTFVVADGIARAVARVVSGSAPGRRFVDVCSGCGHLARTLDTLRPHDAPPVVALDASFWRLRVMQRFIAPDADAICMDANLALPLASHAASLAICNDAFSYIWSKRALSADMQRLAHPHGAVVLTHVHSMFGENATAGNTLAPSAYLALLDRPARLFDDARLRDERVRAQVIDLETPLVVDVGPDVVSVVASNELRVFAEHVLPDPLVYGVLRVNPLYLVTADGDQLQLELSFPSAHYAEEFRAARAYLPQTLAIARRWLERAHWNDAEVLALRRTQVLIDVPESYV
jgi:uncharacterized protein YbaR (Trm112 family)